MKKLISVLTLALLLPLFSNAPAYATDSFEATISEDIVCNEFEYYLVLKETSTQQLLDEGYTQEDIIELKNFSFEEALLERAQLPVEELFALGYSRQEISILKNYRGEPLVATSSVLRATATATGNIRCLNVFGNTYEVEYRWSWDKAPLFLKEDLAAISWEGCDSNSHVIVLNPSDKRASILYYSAVTGYVMGTQSLPFKTTPSFYGCSVEYSAAEVIPETADGTSLLWANNGSMIVRLTPAAGSSVHQIKLYAALGHQIVTLSSSIDLTPGPNGYSFSFSPSTGTDTVAEISGILKSNGTFIAD